MNTQDIKKSMIIRKDRLISYFGLNHLAYKNKLALLISRFFIYFLLINFAFVYMYPFLYMITESFKSPQDSLDPVINWIPRGIYFENYRLAFESLDYLHHVRNSIITSVVPAIGHVIACSLVGYGFARFRFKGRELLFGLAMFTLIIPPQSIIIPLFIQFRAFDMLNTYQPIIIPTFFAAGLKGALFIFIFRQYFRGLPVSLEDAAKIDGCSSLKTYIRIVMPTSQPAILVTSVLSIVWHWNNYFEPSVYLTAESKWTLPMRITNFASTFDMVTGGGAAEGRLTWPLIMAAVTLILIPIIIMYAVLQRRFMKGIATTGLKD